MPRCHIDLIADFEALMAIAHGLALCAFSAEIHFAARWRFMPEL